MAHATTPPLARRLATRLGSTLLVALALALVAVLLLAFAVWLQLRPVAGEWIVGLPLWRGEHAPRVQVSLPRLLQAATDPRFAPWLDGRRVATPVGEVALQWQAGARSLTARCAPCRLRHAALGDRPLALRSAELVMRRDGDWQLSGHVASGAVVLPWRGRLSPTGLQLRGELAPTPIAAVYAIVGDAVPELREARIDGRIGATWQWQLPGNAVRVTPVLTGFAVDGLRTEALLNAALPRHCASTGVASPWLDRALIAAEDRRFFEHAGYDLEALAESFDANQRRGGVHGGASTLTQQLAKLLYTGDERSALRKMRELLYAVEMERTLGKGRILQLYLALAPWGPGVCGADAAARHHLGKPASRLDAIEAAWLVSLLPRPTAEPPPLDRARLAVILNGMTGAGARQHARWMRVLPEWQPTRPPRNRPTITNTTAPSDGASHASARASSRSPPRSAASPRVPPGVGRAAVPDARRVREPAAAAAG